LLIINLLIQLKIMKQITKILTIAILVCFAMPAFANDACVDAAPIACGATVSGSTAGATFDNVGTCGTSNTAPGVWYSVVGDGGQITASTCNQASYDTKISVFTGSCGALSCVGGNDDGVGCSAFSSEVTFPTTAGTTYLILVHGFGSANGDFNLTVTCSGPSSGNDACSGAESIACGDTVTGSTVGASPDGAPFCGTSNTAPGVWYEFTAGSDAGINLTTCSSDTNYDTKLTVYEGSCDGLICVDGNDDDFSCTFSGLQSTVNFLAAEGTTYYILVHGFSSATGNFSLSLECIQPPENDGPCNFVPLTLGEAKEYRNDFASADPGEVSPGAGTGTSSCNSNDGWCSFETDVDNSVWFSFIVPASGSVSVDTPGFDNQLAVWSASDCSDYTTYTKIGANDDSGPGLAAFLELYCLNPGDMLLVQVDGFSGASSSSAFITVSDLEVPELIADAGGCQTKFVGYEPAEGLNYLVGTASGGTPPLAYSWTGDGITTNPDFTSVTVDPTETTTYTLTVTDANGCVVESTVVVNVVDLICDDNGKKISLCHIPPGNPDNPQQICVSENAVETHLAHGDVLGFCGNECTDTNPEPPACADVSIEITTDRFANETSWNLTDEGGSIIASGAQGSLSNETTTNVIEECLPAGCYTFNIFDSFGDGICCTFGDGKYAVTYNGVVTESPTGGAFGSSESVQFGACTQVRQAAPKDLTDLGEISVLPNPFTSRAVINFIPTVSGKATIDIYNINGALVTRILDTQVTSGKAIDAEVLGSQLGANGIYIYQVRIADIQYTGKLVLMR